MKKGSNTRSSLLFEVERLLNECMDLNGELPQILLMENVTQVHSEQNKEDFRNWVGFLESLGYSCFYQDLNAKDYGIPQNRDRTFMVSCLGNYYYDFPPKQELKLRLKDMLEDNVDKKYYVDNDKSRKLIQELIDNGTIEGGQTLSVTNLGTSNEENIASAEKTDVAHTVLARDYKGLPNYGGNAVIQKLGSYTPSEHNASSVVSGGGIAPTVMENHGTVTATQTLDLRIRKLTPRECWRLMSFSDEDYEKAAQVNSDTQLYKQAGNSIVEEVLKGIFREMIE